MIHSFQTDDAVKYGLVEAVMLNNFRFWIAHNKANSKHQHDHRTWTYNSVKAFVELFPYLTVNQIRRCLESLVDQGVLVRGNYNASPYDKTTWFAFSVESFCLVDVAILPNGSGVSAKSDTDIKTADVKTDTKTEGMKKPRKQADQIVLPDWIPGDTWAAFMETRKKKKAANTGFALGLVIKTLAKFRDAGHDPIEALENSIKGGWSDVYEPKPRSQAYGQQVMNKQEALEARNRRVAEEMIAERVQKGFEQ